jgi:hypothetical protein
MDPTKIQIGKVYRVRIGKTVKLVTVREPYAGGYWVGYGQGPCRFGKRHWRLIAAGDFLQCPIEDPPPSLIECAR